MKKAILLNDTSYENHHGCNIVIKNIKENLLKRNIEIIATNPIGKDWSKNNLIMKALDICDVVLINAEGTIHHSSPYGLRLLEIVNVTNKPCILMNMTYQNNSKDFITLIRKFKKVYVRESMSLNELVCEGIYAEVVPDMTFSSLYDVVQYRSSRVFITDSHDIKKSELLYKTAAENNIEFLPILSPYEKFSSIKSLVKKLKYSFIMHFGKILAKIYPFKYSYLRYAHVDSEELFIDKIKNSKGIITARFHALCIAIQTLTPFIALGSNTHKIEGLLQDIGLTQERIYDMSELKNFKENKKEFDMLFKFTQNESDKIQQYNQNAKKKIANMFDEIRMLI